MKTALIALLAIAWSATLMAGDTPNDPLPDAGASVLLMGIGLTVVGLVRRAFSR